SNPIGWIEGLYEDVLGRFADSIGLNGWLATLASTGSRPAVAFGIVHSPEAHAREGTAGFQQLLGRNPDFSGVVFWRTQLDRGMLPSDMAALIAGSFESLGRAGGLDIQPIFGSVFNVVPVVFNGIGTPFIPPLGGLAIFPSPGVIVAPFFI